MQLDERRQRSDRERCLGQVIEIVLGLTMLLNRAMPLTIVALVPLNVVIVYWNFVLDEGAVEWIFGALSIVFNAILAWPWRHYFRRLFVWKGEANYGARAESANRPTLH